LENLIPLQCNIPLSLYQRVTEAASARGLSLPALLRLLLEKEFSKDPGLVSAPAYKMEEGYRWKTVFLPSGTLLSFHHTPKDGGQKRRSEIAKVVDNKLMYNDQETTPSDFINQFFKYPKNAWRSIWVKRPYDTGWTPAEQIRKAVDQAEELIQEPARERNNVLEPLSLAPQLAEPSAAPERPFRRFGSLPISDKMGPKYLSACLTVSHLFENPIKDIDDERLLIKDKDFHEKILDPISESKGMFNRIVRRDRHDWEHVSLILGAPDVTLCRRAANWLTELRVNLLAFKRIADGAQENHDEVTQKLDGQLQGDFGLILRQRLETASLALEALGYTRSE
jgi:hypothetical protein